MLPIPGEATIAVTIGICTSCVLSALLYFIFRIQLVQLNKSVTIENVFTPFNSNLLMMGVSQNLMSWSEVGYLLPLIQNPMWNASIALSFRVMGAVLFEYTYVQYSYLRAEHILDDILPKINPYISFYTKHCKYLFLANVITRFVSCGIAFTDTEVSLSLSRASVNMYIVNGVSVLVVDLACLYAFVRYLQRTKGSAYEEPDKQFHIIATHGVASACIFLAVLAFVLVYSLLEEEIWDCLLILTSTATFLVLFKMKVALHREKVERLNARLTVVNLVQHGKV
ncbi:hypothetical protein BDR26DRAFT_1006793 [Obelidium mucronatum]|nr:hypothetical protein BDR26DRAFT_1006793 [Obelidium mucronatum]